MLVLRLGFRYSAFRDAYVLRGIGEKVGPVLKPEGTPGRHAAFNGIRPGGAGGAARPQSLSRAEFGEQQQAEARARRRAEREAVRRQRATRDGDTHR